MGEGNNYTETWKGKKSKAWQHLLKKNPHLHFTMFYFAEYHPPALSGKKSPSFVVFKELELQWCNQCAKGGCSDPPQPLILDLLLRKRGGNEGFLFWISELKTVCLGREQTKSLLTPLPYSCPTILQVVNYIYNKKKSLLQPFCKLVNKSISLLNLVSPAF